MFDILYVFDVVVVGCRHFVALQEIKKKQSVIERFSYHDQSSWKLLCTTSTRLWNVKSKSSLIIFQASFYDDLYIRLSECPCIKNRFVLLMFQLSRDVCGRCWGKNTTWQYAERLFRLLINKSSFVTGKLAYFPRAQRVDFCLRLGKSLIWISFCCENIFCRLANAMVIFLL